MRPVLKKILHTFYRPLVVRYIAKDRTYNFKGLQLIINKGVFHPGLFFSTKFLIEYIDTLNIKGKTLLELGCGSGLISVYGARAGAIVTASDINAAAVECAQANAGKNGVSVHTIVSDLFDNIKVRQFDIIIINPPYFKRNPKNDAEYAWFCGENLEYFQKLALQLKGYIHAQSKVIMVLSEDCDVQGISAIFSKQNFNITLVMQNTIAFEKNYIFEINSTL
jgi:release factor glutamine methyltransferase